VVSDIGILRAVNGIVIVPIFHQSVKVLAEQTGDESGPGAIGGDAADWVELEEIRLGSEIDGDSDLPLDGGGE
jgi:hypothetical protein